MATVSVLTLTEKVVLPFCTFVPLAVGLIGYLVWKQDRHSPGETITLRMTAWFLASSAIMIGLAIFHVIFNLAGTRDARIGIGAVAAAFCVGMCAKMHWEVAWVDNDDLLLNDKNETADFIRLDSDTLQHTAPAINSSRHNTKRRYVIAGLTYSVIVFQSAFDGLVLKYNPNGQDSGLQVGMFFVSKLLESIVVSTALIHAAVKTKWYILYMCNFTITVGLSTLAAYEFVSPDIPVAVFESWIFQICLGASGGLLLLLSFYFAYLETRRVEVGYRGHGHNLFLNVVFSLSFAASVITGIFG